MGGAGRRRASPSTALQAALARFFGAAKVFDIVQGLHFKEIDPGRIHGLRPLLFAAAAKGDEVAQQVVTGFWRRSACSPR